MVPSTIFMAVSTSVGTASRVGQEIQMRYRTNRFLDQINESLFKPRGLYIMVMTYRPDLPDEAIVQADMSDPHSISLAKTISRGDKRLKRYLSRLRMSSGTIKADMHMPTPAPLIYPSLDLAIEQQTNQQQRIQSTDSTTITTTSTTTTTTGVTNNSRSPISSTSATIQEYLDRRAQTAYKLSSPNSKINDTYAPTPKEYVNRFCDPDHPVNSGSILGLVTAGTFDPISQGRVRRAENKARRNREPALTPSERHDAYMGRKVRGRVTGTPSKELPLIGKVLKKGLLYLIVMNLPAEADVIAVRDEMDRVETESE